MENSFSVGNNYDRHQDYDIVIFLAIFPQQIEFYGCTKQDIKDHLEIQDEKGNWIYNQHGGRQGQLRHILFRY